MKMPQMTIALACADREIPSDFATFEALKTMATKAKQYPGLCNWSEL